jgi:hypothetical protein
MTQMQKSLQYALFAAGAMLACEVALAGDLPDPSLTPGAVNPNVTQENIARTICFKGYTKTIRPPASFTNRLKKQQIRTYGYADRNPKHYEEDHLIALSIGGAPDDPANLWPEPRSGEWGAVRKDQLEVVLYKKVCARQMTLAQAQREMAEDWITAWKRHVPADLNSTARRRH